MEEEKETENNLEKMKGLWYAIISLFSLLIVYSFYRIYQGESGTASIFPSVTFIFIGLAMLGKGKKGLLYYLIFVFGIISMIAGLYFMFSR